MAQAYDFALNNMGMDFASSSIWNDYIMFLKNVDAVGSYAENQKISAIRKIYHRGVVIPMLNVENLWYENEFNLKSIFTTLKSLPFTFYSLLYSLIAFDNKFVSSSVIFLHFRIRWINSIGVSSCDNVTYIKLD